MPRDDLIHELEAEYDEEAGFIGQARYRRFDAAAFERLLSTLRRCPDYTDGAMDARLARCLWWMPLILTWQVEGLRGEGLPHDDYAGAARAIENELIRILGVP